MREEKPKSPSQKKKVTAKNWFWPVIYTGIAVLFVGIVWGYNAMMKDSASDMANMKKDDAVIVETNASKELLKYPFEEALLDEVVILQEYYDFEAEDSMREKAMLVFNQTYVTSTGVTISIKGEPFDVVAALSGTVEEIITDPFTGGEIVIAHADGMKTIYNSVTDILVKKGDEVTQGEVLATATQNEWNAKAGVHLHFEVEKDGVAVNPRLYLAF